MTITSITDHFSVSGELSEQDFDTFNQKGVSLLINVRPDNESPDQQNNDFYQKLSKQHGIRYRYIPVQPCQYPVSAIEQFADAIHVADGKVHGFCRTGARAAHLWALANASQQSIADTRDLLKANGFDLNVFADQHALRNSR